MPSWRCRLGHAGASPPRLGIPLSAVSLIAGKGATLAMAGAVVLADALAERSGTTDAAFAAYEAWLRSWAQAARRNVRLLTPADRFQLLVHDAGPRLAARPYFAPVGGTLLNRGGEPP